MDVKMIKINEEFFVTFLNFKNNIKSYSIKKSFEVTTSPITDFHFNLNENEVDLYVKELNIFSPYIKLEPLHDVKHYYTINLYTDEGILYPLYIDYNQFYSIKNEDETYHFNFMKKVFTKEKEEMLKFYIRGVYGDIHKINLVEIKNKNEAFFKIPSKSSLESEAYDIIAELNGNRIVKAPFPVLKKDSIDFSVVYNDFGDNLKVDITPKFITPTLDELEVYYEGKLIRRETRKKLDLNKIIRGVTFFVPSSGFNKNKSFKLVYKASESSMNKNNEIHKECSLSFSEKKEIVEIFNFEQEYKYDSDSLFIKWDNKSKEKMEYSIEILGRKFTTKYPSLEIENFSSFNNNQELIEGLIKCSDINKSINETDIKLKIWIKNEAFVNLSNGFTPIIDYSQTLYCDKAYGRLKWSSPGFKHYVRIKISTELNKRYLDEFSSPWIKTAILDETTSKFDEKYKDYEEEISFSFFDGKELKKAPKDATISYSLPLGQWFCVDGKSYIDIPLWFNAIGSKYEVELEMYDVFNKKVGENKIEFVVKDADVGDIEMNQIRINRNQYMQFGETGTVGEFFKIEKPRPIDVRNHYSSDFKTYLGESLGDGTNIDSEGNSMFYYLNTNEADYITFNYRRAFNFYSLNLKIEKEGILMFEKKHEPKGNDFKDNVIQIPKLNLKEEGEYKMKIQTFSSSGQASKVKEVSFFIYNEKPEKPFVKIKADDHYILNENEDSQEIYINKKYFELEVTNNDLSQKYSGWKFKETHFYFRTMDTPFLQFADYVVQTNVTDGSIVMKNTVPVENGDYECKVVNYDYSGNASDPHVFTFKLRSEIKLTPHSIFTNKPRQNMSWEIKKSQDSDGFIYFYRYSKDGITYEDYAENKYESPYYPDKGDERVISLSLPWLQESSGFLEGFYKLVAYEYSRKHPNGQKEYEFESPIVEVNEVANPSNPIYAKSIKDKVAVFEKSSSIEWAYTSDLNEIIFETLHSTPVTDNPDTPIVEDMHYEIIVIEPHKPGESTNIYKHVIEQPESVGNFTIEKIADLCNITNQKEGVWEIRFVTVDYLGNTNETRGYYTYRVCVVKRNPDLNNVTLSNNNGTKYFGLNSDVIGLYIDYSKTYTDISNYDEFKHMFPIINCDVLFLENPFNTQYTNTIKQNDKDCVTILQSLSETDKATHSRDGRYNVLVTARDPLGRLSQQVDRAFYIDTTTDSEISFVSNNTFIEKTITLSAVAVDDVKRIYYKTSNHAIEKPEFNIEEIKTWDKADVGNISVGQNTYNGLEIKDLQYETDGYKTVYYAIEENSGNICPIVPYSFRIDTTNTLIPIFDYSNKINFSKLDEFINLSWELTNKSVVEFEVMLNKIKINQEGGIDIEKCYALQVDDLLVAIPVGPEETSFTNIGSDKNVTIKIEESTTFMSGQYMLTVKGLNIYGSQEQNEFIFQIDTVTPIDLAASIINNKITLEQNTLTWTSIRLADFYEVSYDSKTWMKTTDNKFFINTDNLYKTKENLSYVYLRWKSKTGLYSEASKVILNIALEPVKKPTVNFYTDEPVTENNSILKWTVTIDDPEKVKGIYYSFDKEKWHYKTVNGRLNAIMNDSVSYPVSDGIYDVFLIAVDENPSVTNSFNKSEMVHSYVQVFANTIEKPIFSSLINGQTLKNPHRVFIDNKQKNVKYNIYVNGKAVEEGYEISSSTYRKFTITCMCKKYGIDKVYDVLNEDDDFHVWSICTEPYVIDINNSQIVVSIDHANTSMIIDSTPSLTTKQIILFKEKGNESSQWNVLKKGDVLTLTKEWEFKVSTITVL